MIENQTGLINYGKKQEEINDRGNNGFLFLNIFLIVVLIGGYYYVASPFNIKAVHVYILLIGIFLTAGLYCRYFNIKIDLFLIAYLMICLNEILFALLNQSTSYLVTFITCKAVFYIFPFIFGIVIKIYDKKKIFTVLLFSLSFYFITLYTTNKGLNQYPFASRSLAGFATPFERTMFTQLGIGGYEFVYAGVFLIPAVLFCGFKSKNILIKMSNLLAAAFAIYVIIKADYTIAVILIVFLLITIFFYGSETAKKILFILSFLLAIGLLFIFGKELLEIISQFAYNNGLYAVSMRFNMLSKVFESNQFGDLRRIELYKESLSLIFQYPIIGGMWFNHIHYSNHSGLLDYIAQFGINSIWLFIYLYKAFSMQVKSIKNPKLKTGIRIIHFYFIIFIILNMFSIYVSIGIAIFFIVPLIFVYEDRLIEEGRGITYG